MERLQVRMRLRRDDKRWRRQGGRLDLKVCNMAFECGVVPENCRSTVIVPLNKGKGERTECSNCRGISLLA